MARLQNQYIFNEILDRLSGLASNIKLRASFNLLDSNVLSEDFYLGLLNLVYGWNLHNANSDVQNVQGIDLIDRNRKIVVQVTSTCLKAIYKQAQRFVPDLHHTFEQLLEYHNSMLVRKADFIADELPTIENQIVKLEARIDELHKSEKVLSQKLTQSVSYVDYENLVTELTQKYERMGSLKQQIEQIDKVEERIERLKQKLADINGVLFTEEFKGKVQKQLDKLNFYLRGISFVDLAHLKKTDIQDGFLRYIRRKTRQQIIVRWEPQMQALVDKYRAMSGDSPYLFPFLQSSACEQKSRAQLYHNVESRITSSLKSARL